MDLGAGMRGGESDLPDVSAVKDRERVPCLKVHLWRQQLPHPARVCVFCLGSHVAGKFLPSEHQEALCFVYSSKIATGMAL